MLRGVFSYDKFPLRSKHCFSFTHRRHIITKETERAPHFPPHTGNALPLGHVTMAMLTKQICAPQDGGTLTLLLDYSGSLLEPCHRRRIDKPSRETVSRGQRRSRPARFLTHWKTWQKAMRTSHISTTSPQGTIPHSEPQFWEPAAWQATPKEGVWTWISDRTAFSLLWEFCCYFSFAMCKVSFQFTMKTPNTVMCLAHASVW